MAHGGKERAVSLISLKCSVISERNEDLAFCIFDFRGVCIEARACIKETKLGLGLFPTFARKTQSSHGIAWKLRDL